VDGYFDETFGIGREYVESVVEIEVLRDQSVGVFEPGFGISSGSVRII
jgi:hypothetical protein